MRAILFLLIICVAMFSGCRKDTLVENFISKTNTDTVHQDTASTYQSLQDFFAQNSAPKQVFTVNPSAFNTINGSKGGKIYIPSNTFTDSLGNQPSGNINITYVEIYSVKDMILSNKPTVAGGNILVSGGEIYFKATTSTGNSLTVNQPLDILIPTDSPMTGMQVFEGENNDTTGGVNWLPADSAWVNLDSTGYYWVNIFMLNYYWINCDYFYSNPNPKTTVTLNFSSNPPATIEINAYLIFKDINSIYGLYPYYSNTAQANNIPEGTTPTAVAIGVSNPGKKLYFAKSNIAITTNFTTTLTLTPITTDELNNALDNL